MKNTQVGQSSPNPGYKQDIEVIDTANLFNVNNVVFTTQWTLGEKSGSEFTVIKGGGNFNWLGWNKYIDFLTDKYETVSYGFFCETKSDTTKILAWSDAVGKSIYFNTIYTTRKGIAERAWVSNDLVLTNETIKLLIYKGTISKPYLPYGYIGIEQSGKNKFNKNKPNIDTSVYITMDGTKIGYAVNNFSIYLPVKSNTHYVISMDKSSSRFRVACTNSLIKHEKDFAIVPLKAQTNDNGNKIIIQTTKDSKYLYVNLTDDSNFDSLMIEENTIVTEYEPYHKPIIYPINLNGNSLAKVENIFDVLNIYRNGKVEIKKNTGVLEFNNLALSFSNPNKFQYNISGLPITFKLPNALCNYFENLSEKFDTDSLFMQYITKNNIENCFNLHPNKSAIRFYSKMISSLDEFKNLINNKDVKLYYNKEFSTVIDLPSIEPIKLWEGTNIFNLITNLETEYTVEYVIDKNSIVNESEAVKEGEKI